MTGSFDIAAWSAGKPVPSDGFVRIAVNISDWIAIARALRERKIELVSLWMDGDSVRVAVREPEGGCRVIASLAVAERKYPSVGKFHKPAIRLERAARDLYGVEPEGLPDARGWLDHGVWPALPPGAGPRPRGAGSRKGTDYQFLPVEGPGLHQIPVGPVHAGIIEPGHFRFSASGELVVRLEERLGYVHKGIDALARGTELEAASRLAGRISGDSTVAYAFAFALAVERCLGWPVPVRAATIRGVMAELERVANHIGDVGAICNDASVVAIQARCTIVREDILSTIGACFGHRLMMDRIVPGGVTVDLDEERVTALQALLKRISAGFDHIAGIYDHMASLQDRTVTTGIVKADLVEEFAPGGYVGRASGRSYDARTKERYAPYDSLSFDVPTRSSGDVDGRVWIRIEEIRQSLSIIRELLSRLPKGPIASPRPASGQAVEAVSAVEAFRGDVFMAVRLDVHGRIARFHVRDASWFHWPLLEAAIEGNIVADFPLCNKSFNCSYSGHDL